MAHQPNSENEQFSRSLNKSLENIDSKSFSTQTSIEFCFLTLFPEIFQGVFKSSLFGKAQDKGLVSFNLTDIRDFAQDKHRKVDDTPYGGSEGMLLKADVLYAAWESVIQSKVNPASHTQGSHTQDGFQGKTATLLLSPQGEVFSQEMA